MAGYFAASGPFSCDWRRWSKDDDNYWKLKMLAMLWGIRMLQWSTSYRGLFRLRRRYWNTTRHGTSRLEVEVISQNFKCHSIPHIGSIDREREWSLAIIAGRRESETFQITIHFSCLSPNTHKTTPARKDNNSASHAPVSSPSLSVLEMTALHHRNTSMVVACVLLVR